MDQLEWQYFWEHQRITVILHHCEVISIIYSSSIILRSFRATIGRWTNGSCSKVHGIKILQTLSSTEAFAIEKFNVVWNSRTLQSNGHKHRKILITLQPAEDQSWLLGSKFSQNFASLMNKSSFCTLESWKWLQSDKLLCSLIRWFRQFEDQWWLFVSWRNQNCASLDHQLLITSRTFIVITNCQSWTSSCVFVD